MLALPMLLILHAGVKESETFSIANLYYFKEGSNIKISAFLLILIQTQV